MGREPTVLFIGLSIKGYSELSVVGIMYCQQAIQYTLFCFNAGYYSTKLGMAVQLLDRFWPVSLQPHKRNV